MPDETERERERRLIAEAERRARVDAKLEAHDRQFQLNAGIFTELTNKLGELAARLDGLAADFRQSIAVAESRARDAERAAQRQVTSRELYLTAASVTVAILSALAAGGVLG